MPKEVILIGGPSNGRIMPRLMDGSIYNIPHRTSEVEVVRVRRWRRVPFITRVEWRNCERLVVVQYRSDGSLLREQPSATRTLVGSGFLEWQAPS